MDTCARALKAAAALLESGEMEAAREGPLRRLEDPRGAGDAERQP
jgi:xylose isomerase